MKVSAIIISDGKSDQLRQLTQQTINSLKTSEKHMEIEVIVVEKQDIKYKYVDKHIKQFPGKFNYNKNLNLGLRVVDRQSEYILMLNNDLTIPKFTISKMVKYMSAFDLDVASPVGDDNSLVNMRQGVNKGYEVRKNLFGWFIMMTKSAKINIDQIDSDTHFWYSDNAFLVQCEELDLSVGSLPKVYVKHLESVTFQTLKQQEQIDFTSGDKKRFDENYE